MAGEKVLQYVTLVHSTGEETLHLGHYAEPSSLTRHGVLECQWTF